MRQEKKHKLRTIAVLVLFLLVGGTFAFQAFNQQVINDRLRENQVAVGGRVHDYYNRDTENKDVFVENYGQEPIMARIRLSEFMEIQERGTVGFTPIAGGSRGDVSTWTPWKPSEDNLDDRVGDSDAFDQYSNLTFGWERNGQTAPWYLPTFNHDKSNLMTAAAGHARDWVASGGATDGVTDGTTHPGDGTDEYWSQGESYDNSAGKWEGSAVTRETVQHLPQAKEVMTLESWSRLPNAQKIGYFWVVDHETGWAYWASQLHAGQATSYLLDAAEMTAAADQISGSYYYGIHVDSQLINLEEVFKDEPTEGHDGNLGVLLKGIRNNAVDDEIDNGGGLPTENPDYNDDSPVGDFNFGIMNPGRIFTMEGEQFRYLEDMQNGNHLIIRNDAFRRVSWNEQEDELISWYGQLEGAVQEIVAPVADSFTVGMITGAQGGLDAQEWLFRNLASNPVVYSDVTRVVPEAEGGVKRAFALSLRDVNRLSGTGLGFPNPEQRVGANNSWWWTRTPSSDDNAWRVNTGARLGQFTSSIRTNSATNGGMRPALIIHQNVGG